MRRVISFHLALLFDLKTLLLSVTLATFVDEELQLSLRSSVGKLDTFIYDVQLALTQGQQSAAHLEPSFAPTTSRSSHASSGDPSGCRFSGGNLSLRS